MQLHLPDTTLRRQPGGRSEGRNAGNHHHRRRDVGRARRTVGPDGRRPVPLRFTVVRRTDERRRPAPAAADDGAECRRLCHRRATVAREPCRRRHRERRRELRQLALLAGPCRGTRAVCRLRQARGSGAALLDHDGGERRLPRLRFARPAHPARLHGRGRPLGRMHPLG